LQNFSELGSEILMIGRVPRLRWTAYSLQLWCSDARLFCKNKQVNLKNKQKIGNLTEKQAQNALTGKFNKSKNQQENQIKNRVAIPKKQAQNEQIFPKTRPICL